MRDMTRGARWHLGFLLDPPWEKHAGSDVFAYGCCNLMTGTRSLSERGSRAL
jgi:hypothetical protein